MAPSNFSGSILLLLLLYPLILLLGSLTSQLSPSLRSTPYNPTTQSHPPHLAPSYFARKSNVFNLYFVKVAWAWYTGAFVFFLVISHRFASLRERNGSPSSVALWQLRALARYAATTIWWGSVTQWFFGPPIIDRSFKLSGGRCEMVLTDGADINSVKTAEVSELVTAVACKVAGGTWKGGHDISGHVFILILGSAFLFLESAPALLSKFGWHEQSRSTLKEDRALDYKSEKPAGERDLNSQISIWLLVAVIGLSWWMLLMTATYFHTWFEKFTGLLVAYIAISSVYLLPQVSPIAQTMLGTPGVDHLRM